MATNPRVSSFTVKFNALSNTLYSNVGIYPSFDPDKNEPLKKGKKYKAIWDTGATNSVITDNVINDLELKPTGMTKTHTVGGLINVNTYLINIALPNRVGFKEVIVTKGEISDKFDVLIGMDIIINGDFAVTNKDEITMFSFRVPSVEHIDFVKKQQKDTEPATSQKISRNAQCPCGSGKKYKFCCGKEK
jgi:hypothetical protein